MCVFMVINGVKSVVRNKELFIGSLFLHRSIVKLTLIELTGDAILTDFFFFLPGILSQNQ